MKINKKVRSIMIIVMCIFFICAVIVNSIVSTDMHHLETCHTEKCTKCNLIHMAINFLNNIENIGIFLVTFNVFIPIIQMIFSNTKNKCLKTLFDFKVQFNE